MEGKTVLGEDADIYRHPDEDLTEKEKWNHMDSREKWQYFKDYYFRYILFAGIIVLCIASLIIFKPAPMTETALYIGFVNEEIDPEGEEEVKQELVEALSLDPEKESVLFDYTLFIEEQGGYLTKKTMEVLMEQFYTGNMDLFIAEKHIFEAYEEQGAFLKLKDVLSEECYKALEGFLYDDYSYSLKDSEIYHTFAKLEDPVVGICVKSKHMERNEGFIKYLLSIDAICCEL